MIRTLREWVNLAVTAAEMAIQHRQQEARAALARLNHDSGRSEAARPARELSTGKLDEFTPMSLAELLVAGQALERSLETFVAITQQEETADAVLSSPWPDLSALDPGSQKRRISAEPTRLS
jgi:hypothetical protein